MELCAIVRLQREDPERESLSNLVQEADCRALITPIVDLQDSNTSAVVDRRELIEPFSCPRNPLQELHIHLQAVPRLGFLVALPALTVRLVLLVSRQPAHVVLDQDSMHSRTSDLHLVEAVQVRSDSVGPKVIVLPQVEDFAHYCRRRRSRRVMRRSRPISQASFPMLVIALLPALERGS